MIESNLLVYLVEIDDLAHCLGAQDDLVEHWHATAHKARVSPL